MEEIKPCPFCGSECFIESQFFGDSEDELFRVRCKDSLHALDWWEGKPERAVSVWNQRTKPAKMYLVYYSRIRPFFGSYDEDLLFVTENKEKADAYVEKFNAILKKWRDYYRDLLNRHPYRTDRTTSIPEWIMFRSFKLGKIHQCFYKELEVR